jgi:hypothetical protein
MSCECATGYAAQRRASAAEGAAAAPEGRLEALVGLIDYHIVSLTITPLEDGFGHR